MPRAAWWPWTADRGDHEQADIRNRTSLLDRALRLFAPVKGGEGGTVLLMALNVFLLLTAYYIIKPVREALILAEWGAEAKIYASAGTGAAAAGRGPAVQPAGRPDARAPADRHRAGVFRGLPGGVLSAGLAGVSRWASPSTCGSGIFNMMVVAQFWSFANDYYTEEQGKRLFAIIGFGMSAGAVFGGFITRKLIHPLGLYQLMLLSAALLMVSLVLTSWRPTGGKTGSIGDRNRRIRRNRKQWRAPAASPWS